MHSFKLRGQRIVEIFSWLPTVRYMTLLAGLLKFPLMLVFVTGYAYPVFNRLVFPCGYLFLITKFRELNFASCMTFFAGNIFMFPFKLKAIVFFGFVFECDIFPLLLHRMT
jgi:hypothetical protein